MSIDIIKDLNIEEILEKMIQGTLPLSTFALPMLDDNDTTYGTQQENVLMKAIYLEHPYQKEVLEMIKQASIEDLDLSKTNTTGFAAVHLAILNAKVPEAQTLLCLMLHNHIEITKTYADMSILQLAILSQNLSMIQLIEHYDNDIHYCYLGDGKNKALDIALEYPDNQELAEYVANMYSIQDIQDWMKGKNFGTSEHDFDPFDMNFRSLKIKTFLEAICEKRSLESTIDEKKNSVKKLKV